MSVPESASEAASKRPRAVIFACAGPELSGRERRFFAETDPLGFILFANNIESPNQVRSLVAALRAAVGRGDAPVLIDQEGGRVARLGPPHWRAPPPARRLARLAAIDEDAGREAARINGRLIACELSDLGITVDCAPVVDVPIPDGHDVIGDRAHGDTPEMVADLGGAVCEGLLEGGVIPVLKHIPGHGRARADSHVELPVVDTPLTEMARTDFRPFRDLSATPWAMTAHVLYRAIDPDYPATQSATVIDRVVRGDIGFQGLLLSDDIGMEALKGSLAERGAAALKAGCDAVLHCSGDFAGMAQAATGAGPMTGPGMARLARGEEIRLSRAAAAASIDGAAAAGLAERLETLLGRVADG